MNHSNIQELLFFSNPFGFGPTARLDTMLSYFKRHTSIPLIVVTDPLCSEIIGIEGVQTISLDTRDSLAVEAFLQNHPHSGVISSLNRFAIGAAHKLGIPNAFIDGLTWLWPTIPEEYLLADFYFAVNFLGVDKAVAPYPQITKVPSLFVPPAEVHPQKGQGLPIIQLGGCLNPLVPGLPINYLNFLANYLCTISTDTVVVGGSKAMDWLREKLKDKANLKFQTLKRGQYLEYLQQAPYLITCPGLGATLEGFFYDIPVHFLPAQNLSQHNILKLLHGHGVIQQPWMWTDLEPSKAFPLDNPSLREADSIRLIEDLAASLRTNSSAIASLQRRHQCSVDLSVQRRLTDTIGHNGTEVIFQTLQSKWCF